MPTLCNLAAFAPMQADKPYTAALYRRLPTYRKVAAFGACPGILRAPILSLPADSSIWKA